MSNNIKVAVRVRPLISREKNDKLKKQWEVNESAIYPIDVQTGKRNGDVYNFDHIFDDDCDNKTIYKTVVKPVVEKAVNGFNGSVFAYGQTSSGKTYTMTGDGNELGVISLAVENIFQIIEQSENKKFLLRVSYIEIYNEKIIDLLDVKNTVKVHEDFSGDVILNVKEEVTDSAEKIYNTMKKGDKARKIGETNMNEKSSRSHAIFRIIIESTELDSHGVVNVAHLNLVDLAGSERAVLTKATGVRLKEGAHINRSLSTLSLVMRQLSESQDFINFRDSKLTRILQPSLGGNALTAIICAVTPAALEETHSTLAFASRAKTVKNKPRLNEIVTDEALINRYASEISKLRKDLEKANDNRNLQAQKNEKLEERIAFLEKCIIHSSRSQNSKKISNVNRRRTWCASQRNEFELAVIIEEEVFEKAEKCNNFNNKEEKVEFPKQNWVPASERRPRRFQGFSNHEEENVKTPSPVHVTENSEINESVVEWLTSSKETPKSELRKRVEYLEHEYFSLCELTRQEKSIAHELQTELEETKKQLYSERKFKTDVELELMEVKKKNKDLLKSVEVAQKEIEKRNDYEYLAEMYKEKFKKRENELLECLKEARETTENSISSDYLPLIQDYKEQLTTLKENLISEKPLEIDEKFFKPTNNLDLPEDLKDFLSIFENCSGLISNCFSSDSLINEMQKERKQLINKMDEKDQTYALLIKKQEEEIKCLSESILKLANNKTDENLTELLKSKDKEIEELSDKIMDYLEELKTVEVQNEVIKEKLLNEENQIKVLENQVLYLNCKISELEENDSQKNIENQEIRKELQQETNKIKQMEQEKQEINHVNEKAKDELKNKIKYLESQLISLNEINEKKDVENGMMIKISKLEEDVRKQNHENERIKNELEEKITKIKQLQQEIQQKNYEHEKIRNEFEDKINILENREEPMLITIFELEKELDKNIVEKENLEKEIWEEKTRSSELLDQIKFLENQIESFQLHTEKLEKEIKSKICENDEIKNEFEDILKFYVNQQFELQIEQLQEKVNSQKRENEIIVKQFDDEKNKNAQLLDQIKTFENQKESFKLCINKLEKEIKSKIFESDVIKNEFEDMLEYYENKQFESHIKQLQEKVDSQKLENEIIVKQFDDEKNKNAQLLDQIEILENQQRSLNIKIFELEKHILEEETQSSQLLEQIDILENQQQPLSIKIFKLEKELKDVHDKNIVEKKEMEKEILKKETRSLQLLEQIETFKNQIESFKLSVNELKAEIKSKTFENDAIKKEFEDKLKFYKSQQFQSQITQLQEKVNSQNINNKIIVKQLEEEKNINKQLLDNLNILQNQLEVFELKIKDQEIIIENLTLEINNKPVHRLSFAANDIPVKEKNRVTTLENQLLSSITQLEETKKSKQFLEITLNEVKKNLEDEQKRNNELLVECKNWKGKFENVAKVSQNVNSKIKSYNNVVSELKNKNALLQLENKSTEEQQRKLTDQITVLKKELENRHIGENSKWVELHSKFQKLKEENEKLKKIIERLQDQNYKTTSELTSLTKTLDNLTIENKHLSKINSEQKNKIIELQDMYKSAKGSLQLFEKQNTSCDENSRILGSSENVKINSQELKSKRNKEERKIKRQSLHDSSRDLETDQNHLQNKDMNKEKKDKNSQENKPELELENRKLRNKCDQLINLCKIRKVKINELEHQLKSTENS